MVDPEIDSLSYVEPPVETRVVAAWKSYYEFSGIVHGLVTDDVRAELLQDVWIYQGGFVAHVLWAF